MTLQTRDRVVETSSTTGTGALTLTGAVTGYQRFSSRMSIGDTCYYVIEGIDVNGVPTGEWETGLGTYSALNTLTRTTVSESSNADAATAFSTGTKRVYMATTAAALVALSAALNATSVYPLAAPDNSLFSWVNQGGASVTVNPNGSVSLRAPAAAGTIARLRVKSLPAATPYKITAGIIGSPRLLVSNQSVGIALRDSVSGKLKLFYVFTDNTGQALVGFNWTDANTPSAAMTTNVTIFPSSAPIFLQAEDDGVNVTLRHSHDGYNFTDFFAVSRTSFMTADQCGFFAWDSTNARPVTATLFRWSES